MPKEIWKDIINFPGYQVSNTGEIKSLKRKIAHKRSGYITIRERLLRYSISNAGYFCCHLTDINGRHKMMNVHRLVALSFLGHPPVVYYQVNHKDGNKLNNVYTNLEWMTRRENSKHAVDVGLIKVGEKSNCHKLSKKNIEYAKKLYATGKYTNESLARKFRVSWSAINSAIRGQKNWKQIASADAKFLSCTATIPNGAKCKNFARAFMLTCYAHRDKL